MTLVTIKEACRQAGIGRTTAYAYLAEGRLERARLGAKTLITQRSLDALIEEAIAAGSQTAACRTRSNQPTRRNHAAPACQGNS